MLKNASFRKTKLTRKPRLTKKIYAKRLAQCLKYKSQTIEDQKNVIFSNETSVILLYRRGSYRIQRTKDKRFLRSYIRERQKGASKFIFQGYFSYDKKGPYYYQLPKTVQEKRDSKKEIKRLNNKIKPTLRTAQEIKNSVRRLNLY